MHEKIKIKYHSSLKKADTFSTFRPYNSNSLTVMKRGEKWTVSKLSKVAQKNDAKLAYFPVLNGRRHN